MKDILSYDKAFEELQEIVNDMEVGEIGVDALSEKVKRASELLKICKAKLTSTEDEIQKVLKDLE